MIKAEFKDFVGVFNNVVSKEYCNSLIDFYDNIHKLGKSVERKKHDNVSPIDKNNKVYYFRTETDPLIMNSHSSLLRPFVDAIGQCYNLYVEKYGVIESLGRHLLDLDIKIQKTLPSEGYHIWHPEICNAHTSRRLLMCLLYLNDVDEGGETEFLYQQRRVKPVVGQVLICPTSFTHTHRGNPPLKTAKYMINTWMEFTTE